MIGIITDYPDDLRKTGLIPGVSKETYPSDVYASVYDNYSLMYAFTYGTAYQASAAAQALIYEECHMIVYLSYCIIDKPKKPINVVKYNSSEKFLMEGYRPQLIGFMDSDVNKEIIGDKSTELPYNEQLKGIISTCTYNEVPLMILLDSVKDPKDADYAKLGSLLARKLSKMLEQEYMDSIEDVLHLDFNPVEKIDQIFSLESKEVFYED